MAASYSRFKPFITISLGAACGSLATYYGFTKGLLNVNKEQEYYSIFENRETKWDFNWDRRDPKSLVKPIDPNNSKLQNEYNQKIEEKKSRATRHIFLIRHGQYNLKGETDEERQLTELGRRQALYTGERLSVLDYPWTSITQSTMTRAMETCSLIRKHLPADIPLSSTDLLREGAPVPPDPPSKHWKPDLYFYRDGSRIEAAFRKFMHRAPPDQKEDSYEIIVCHANVIRYFVMRTLQLTPEAWLRLGLDHASITTFSIYPNGRVALRGYSNSGYMPPDAISS
ncbi:Hypothetical protein CINCED_3A020028 [Cinara cedri]|uniref:Serine/threonine-protein phosphatase PGAM5, mitochondrial n=1 Tax=Cinara cedri TaxID=506608 RepID=A0A5E4M3N1_9HEMI|nr:Hypothetical protein CINCED_3A020028 [Cinara cedri]